MGFYKFSSLIPGGHVSFNKIVQEPSSLEPGSFLESVWDSCPTGKTRGVQGWGRRTGGGWSRSGALKSDLDGHPGKRSTADMKQDGHSVLGTLL